MVQEFYLAFAFFRNLKLSFKVRLNLLKAIIFVLYVVCPLPRMIMRGLFHIGTEVLGEKKKLDL